MKRILSLLTLLGTALSAQTDSAASPWTHTLVSAVTLTQVSYTDWTAGGENAMAYTVSLDGRSVRDAGMFHWSNSYKVAYGQTRLGSKGMRKIEDKLELESVLTYKLGTHVNPYASATFKSQFDDGFKYDDAAGTKVQTSAGFDPVYMTQAVGVGYEPVPQVRTRLGAALREVLSDAHGYADDPKTAGEVETSKVEGGLESVTDVSLQFEENLLFTSKLELFSPFHDPDVIILRSDSMLAAKVSSYITVNLTLQLINDANITARTQVKQGLAMGLTYTLL